MDIRELDEPLLPLFRETRLRALREHPRAFGASVADEDDKPEAFWRARIREPGCDDFILCGLVGNVVAGIVAFSRETGEKRHHRGSLNAVYLAPEHRGGGRAKALVQAALERAYAYPSPGVETIALCVNESNVAARRLYESLGFVVIGRDPDAMRVDGKRVVELMMQRTIPNPTASAGSVPSSSKTRATTPSCT